MPVLLPEDPQFSTESERLVWERLRDALGEDDVLVANLRLTDETRDHEADLVVLMPGVGCLVLEVKGGSVWTQGDEWWMKRRGKDVRVHPVDQARRTKYALRDYVGYDPRWGSRLHTAWAHGVVVPYAAFDPSDAPDLPRWALHDRDDLASLGERVRDNAWGMRHDREPPTVDDVLDIAEILTGRLPTSYDVNAEAADRAATADRLTQEQAVILGVTRLLHRVEVRGGAGSGKTVLALQQAKELSRGRTERPAQRVALLCYSIGLAEHLKRTVAGWPRKDRPAFVGTFHEFGRQWGAPDGDRQDSDFWEHELPRRMGELATELPDGKRYDAVVVDEAQDFADDWWIPLLGALRDEETGGLYVFSDEHQRIFARFGRPPVSLVPLVLDHNLRNTKQIHDSFGPLAPSRMRARGGDGPAVRFVPSPTGDALDAADDAVDLLLEEGWAPGGVALLTTGHRHPEQIATTERVGHEGYWSSYFAAEDVFYGHVLGCKGLERPAVVLCVNEAGDRDRARERLYVGMSRATDQLVVVGDPDVVRAIGGDVVAGKLGIG
ncbi:MAG TPA: NERD domain-containing protein [Nocardioides sp.]